MDSLGFLVVSKFDTKNISDSTIQQRINGVSRIKSNLKGEIVMEQQDNCWICNQWQEHKFIWVPGNLL